MIAQDDSLGYSDGRALYSMQEVGNISEKVNRSVGGEQGHSIDISKYKLLASFKGYGSEYSSAVLLVDEYGAYRYKVGDFVTDDIYVKGIFANKVTLSSLDVSWDIFLYEGLDDSQKNISDVDYDMGNSNDGDKGERLSVLDKYDLTPVIEGEAQGYIIGEKFPAGMLNLSGAKPGDVIISVNGYPVGEQGNDDLALNSFRTTMKAEVLIRRGGDYFTYNFSN